jgi:hypothetical protein
MSEYVDKYKLIELKKNIIGNTYKEKKIKQSLLLSNLKKI